jgi:hypothetical protein
MLNFLHAARKSLGAVLLFSAAAAHAELAIDSNKAAFHVGSEAMVCGQVVEVKSFSKGIYLNLGERYPRQHLSVVVFDGDVPAFDARFGGMNVFQGRKACVRGRIDSYKNSLQIKVANPTFLRLMK